VTWTYAGAPGTATAAQLRDAVRLQIGDVDTKEQQLTDEVIAYYLGTGTDILGASISCVRNLIAYYSRQVNNSRDGLSVSAEPRAQHYRDLLDDLLYLQGDAGLIPSVGGISVSDKAAAAANADLVQPIFSIGMDDNPGTTSNDPPPGPDE
jgi:hypothetical protein